MFPSDAPPLPSAAPLTAAAAIRWRTARTAWRLDSRWLALAPVAFVVLATAVEPDTGRCSAQAICRDTWGSALAAWSVLAEIVLLAAKVRVRALVPPVVLVLLWYLPQGLVTPLARWSAVLLQLLLTAVLLAAEAGRRRARQQLDELMAPPVPFPWTAAGAPSPVHRDGPPVLRRTLGALLLVAAVAVPLYGLWAQAQADAAAEQATRVTGTAGASDQDGVLTVRFPPPGGGPERTAALDLWWQRRPQPGEPVPLLVDGDSVHALGDEYDVSGQLTAGGLIALLGLILLGSAATASARRTRPAFEGHAPALAVRVRADIRGDLLVQPLDGPPDGPGLWRLVEHDRYRWARDGGPGGAGPGWVPEPLDVGRPPTRLPGPALHHDEHDEYDEHDEHDEHEDYAEEYEDYQGAYEKPLDRTGPDQAAARLARAGRSVPAVLYRGPDGHDRQLLVRPGLLDGDPDWVAAVVAPAARAPRLGRRTQRYRERELAVAALTAETVAAAPEAGPDTEPVAARRWEMPTPLRVAAGPLAALLVGTAVVLLGDDGWWEGLLRPLWIGSMAILACAHTLSWQIVADRNGLRVATALRTRSFRWAEISAAAVHRELLTIRLRSGREYSFASRPAVWLAGRFGDRYDPVALARTVATAAHRPDLRPDRTLPDRLGGPQHLVNRLALIGYAVFTVAHYAL
ncbi:hypothetical protein BX285_1993 [Streptomyces sp. 1114.5]|uniref:hypothetical protein n=1 Tax=Streptomyces sp. 1114.5 TaxID=1938830 RepID=UPI000EB2D46A|nr:hypothetical protein [Streptomyces sp. 1114.5]RKT17612.1 hypothetical protein BX285_1993 [Streptomyces sp. 1114.5]